MSRKKLYKEGLAKGASMFTEKSDELSKRISEQEIDIKKSLENFSEVNDFILEEKIKEDKKQQYGLDQEERDLIDSLSKEDKQFILGLLSSISIHIDTNELQKEYYKQMQLFFNVYDNQILIEIHHLENIENKQQNSFIYKVIIEFLMLNDQSEELILEVEDYINLSKKNIQVIKNRINSRLINLGAYSIINQYVSSDEPNQQENTIEKDVIHPSSNKIILEGVVHDFILFWQSIINYSVADEKYLSGLYYSEEYDLKERSVIQDILEKNKINDVVKVNEVIAFSDFFLLTNEHLFISSGSDLIQGEIDSYTVIMIEFNKIKSMTYVEDDVSYLKDRYDFKDYSYEELELYIEIDDSSVKTIDLESFSSSPLIRYLFGQCLINLLIIIYKIKNNIDCKFDKQDIKKKLIYMCYNTKKPFSWWYNTKKNKMNMKTCIKNTREFNMNMEIVGNNRFNKFIYSPKNVSLSNIGLVLDYDFIPWNKLVPGAFEVWYQNKVFALNNYADIFFESQKDEVRHFIYREDDVALCVTEEECYTTSEFLNMFLFILGM